MNPDRLGATARLRLRRHRPVVTATVIATTMFGCSGGPADIGAPPTTLRVRSEASTTTGPDFSRTPLPSLEGTTTSSTIVIGVGTVTLEGRVLGPEGPVQGATVRIERLVGEQVAAVQVTSGADGRYGLSQITGGRLRVRAWRSPDLVQIAPSVVFASGRTKLDLEVQAHTGIALRWALAPPTPELGQAAEIVVQVLTKLVSADGVATVVPVVGRYVSLTAAGGLETPPEASGATDERGEARWELTCSAVGTSRLTVALADTPFLPVPTFSTIAVGESTSSLGAAPTRLATTSSTIPVDTYVEAGPTCVPIPTTLPPAVVTPSGPVTAVDGSQTPPTQTPPTQTPPTQPPATQPPATPGA